MSLIFNIINGLLTLYIWIIIVVILFGLIAPHIKHPVLDFLYSIINPPLEFIRENMPFVVANGIDFSPLVLIIGLQLIRALF
jgi:YggT family protein